MAYMRDDARQNLDGDFIMVDKALAAATTPSQDHDYLSDISGFVDSISDNLRDISISIHDKPELQYKEYHAHRVLTNYLKEQEGWQVTPSAYNIDTAFVAVYDSGNDGPVVSFNAEYDALTGIGHACGHNLIAIASLGAALAAARVLKESNLGGKVVLFGTPAEEGGGGKIKLLRAGAYADHNVDLSLMAHPGIDPDAALVRTAAHSAVNVEYFGKEAHAAARPWDGINALDALITAYNAIAILRQQTMPGDIIGCQITDGGRRANIIHAYAAGRFVVRASSRARLETVKKRVVSCFEAGATATGAELKLTWKMSYEDHVPNHALGRSYRHFFNRLGGDIAREDVDILTATTQASTDQGNISHAMPSLHTNFWLRSEDSNGNQLGGPHSPDFEKAARTKESHEKALMTAKSLAATGLNVISQQGLLDEIKKEFDSNQADRMQYGDA